MITQEDLGYSKDLVFPQDEFFIDNAERILEFLHTYEIKTFVEVGVYHGRVAEYLLKNYKFDKYFVVDNWSNKNSGLEAYQQEAMDIIRFDCFNRLSQFRNVSIIQGNSAESADMFSSKSVDAVFIDASHDEESVVKDIIAWHRVPKKLFFGDDYFLGTVQGAVKRIYGDLEQIVNGKTGYCVFWKRREE